MTDNAYYLGQKFLVIVICKYEEVLLVVILGGSGGAREVWMEVGPKMDGWGQVVRMNKTGTENEGERAVQKNDKERKKEKEK